MTLLGSSHPQRLFINGMCATVNQKMVVKAPDWAYIPNITVSRQEVKRSYTPQLQGDISIIVMEFLSDTEGGGYYMLIASKKTIFMLSNTFSI